MKDLFAALTVNVALLAGAIVLIGLGSNFYLAAGLAALAMFLKGK